MYSDTDHPILAYINLYSSITFFYKEYTALKVKILHIYRIRYLYTYSIISIALIDLKDAQKPYVREMQFRLTYFLSLTHSLSLTRSLFLSRFLSLSTLSHSSFALFQMIL